MDVMTIITTGEMIMRGLDLAMKAGQDMAPFVKAGYQVFVKKQPLSADDRTKLLAEEKRLRDILQEPETE